jgi:5-methylthioadenosine/S-adenosylhomocysteine deaminase
MAKKPTFVLRGRIVSMHSENNVVNDGYVAISDGTIQFLTANFSSLPQKFKTAPIIETEGTIYPGLIDLHNHFGYNICPLWVVPTIYKNRDIWRKSAEYELLVKNPMNAIIEYTIASKAIMRYVEAKAIIGGSTTGQGIPISYKGLDKVYEGSMRNVEKPGDPRLLRAPGEVNSMGLDKVEEFRTKLNNPEIGVLFYHLSEGVDEETHQHFDNLKANNLINEKLVGIHSLGLYDDDIDYLKSKGSKIVWSPFSNQILYGKTLNLQKLKSSGITFCLGCDWSPSGSKNLLEELKVAKFASVEQGNVFSDYELAQMVTASAAKVTGWENYLGTIEVSKIADLLVLKGSDKNPYDQLISATEQDITLVVIDGIARYGSDDHMKALHFDVNNQFEKVNIGNREMGLYLFSETSEINDVSFNNSVLKIREIFDDIPAFLKKMGRHEMKAFALVGPVEQDFKIILDNELEVEFDDKLESKVLLDAPYPVEKPVPNSIEFDEPFVTGDKYWKLISDQPNIPPGLTQWLKNYYG